MRGKIIIFASAVAGLLFLVSKTHKSNIDNNLNLNNWLDDKLITWKPQTLQKINFGVYHVFASDDMFIKSNSEIDILFNDMLEQTGSNIIILYIRPSSYNSQKERYDTLINKIRVDGKKLFIGARFDDIQMTFEEYTQQLESFTINIIASIQPDYYGIVIEPTTMNIRHGFNATDNDWIQLINNNSNLTRLVSPNTKTVVGGHKQELNFLQLSSDIINLDIIGVNIYDISGLYDEYSGYLGIGDVIGNTIDYLNLKGKETWVLETWTSYKPSFDPNRIPYDLKWLRVITYYAIMHNMKVVVPFYTGKFISYSNDPTIFQTILYNGTRTPVFYEYQNIVTEFTI